MSQNLDSFIDLDVVDDRGHIYSLKRDESWTTTEVYIYVDRSAKFQLEPEPVKYVKIDTEIDTLNSAEIQFLEAYLSPSWIGTGLETNAKPMFKQIFEKAGIALWLAYEREQARKLEQAREDAKLNALKRKDVRLRKPGTWGIPDEQTLRDAGKEPKKSKKPGEQDLPDAGKKPYEPDEQDLPDEHPDLTRAGYSIREHRLQKKRTYRGYVKDVTGTGMLPAIASYSVIKGTNPSDSEPMIYYEITGEDRWPGSALPEPGNPFSDKNYPTFNQDGQRYIDEIVKNEGTYWYKIHSDNPGRFGKFEVIGLIPAGTPLLDTTLMGGATVKMGSISGTVRMGGISARWSEDGKHLFGFLESGEILVNDMTGKLLGGILGTDTKKLPSTPNYSADKSTQTLTPIISPPSQIPSLSNRNTKPLPLQTDVLPPPSVTDTSCPHKSNIKPKTVFLFVLVALILLGSGAGLFAYNAHQTAIYNANATATTQANNTATAQAIQATSNANAATAQAATQTAQDQATAQAQAATQTAQDQATAQAQTYAAATSTATTYNPYPLNTGTLVINDPLGDNSAGYQWDISPTCVFTNGAYQVRTSATVFSTCTAQATNFISNFAYQIDITIIQGCGGMTFFSQGNNFNYTIFELCQDGSINISVCTGNSISHDCSSGGVISPNFAIQTGSGQSNTLAVVDANNSLSFYVNQQLLQTLGPEVANVAGGKIGVLADISGTESSGQAACSNVKVWTL